MKTWLDGIGFDKSFLDFDDQAGIAPGDDWERRLYSELERSQAVILILTKHWFASKWCFAEFAQARALGKAIFAIVESPAGEQFVSNDIQHLDLTSNREGGLERLARRLREVALDAQGGFDWQKGRAPYPGLMSFEAADAAIFFGRDDEIRRAIERLNARRVQGGAKIFAVVGGSGSGKSSLLKAGVLPRIARDKENFLVLPAFRPGVDPLRELFNAFKTIDAGLSRQRFDEAVTEPAALDLIDALRHAARAPQATVIIPIDQAEELFTRATAETRAAFFKQLSALLAADHPALAVLTLRADHLPDLQTAEGLTARFEHFLLNPMPIERLGLIVQGPARVAGLRAEDALVTAIARDAKTLDVLPLVAFTLRQLHDRYASGGVLMAVHYEALRDGPLSPLEVVVRDAAKATLDAANPTAEELAALREAFVPALVKVNDEGSFVRDEAALDALPPLAQRLLRRLADARLLVIAPDDDGTTRIEVAHEAIFRVWPLLAGWLEEEREFLIGRSRIEKAREDHGRLGGSEQVKGLLSGILLERAKAWLAAHPARFSADEAAYINASSDEAQRLEAERAAERERLRQAELARAKAETERATERAETARRWQRRAIAAAVVFAVLGVIAAALGGVATTFWRSAEAGPQGGAGFALAGPLAVDLNDGQVASAIEHAARAFKELPTEASRSALAAAMFELSPHLRATFDVAANGAESIAWVSGDAILFAPGKVGGALRALDLSGAGRGRAGSEWPMPRLTRAQDGNRATVRAMRGLGAERILAVLDTGALVLTERGAATAQVWTPTSPARSLQAGAHSVAIGARGTLIATASIDGEVTISECAIPANRQAAPDCRERPLANVRGKAVAIKPGRDPHRSRGWQRPGLDLRPRRASPRRAVQGGRHIAGARMGDGGRLARRRQCQRRHRHRRCRRSGAAGDRQGIARRRSDHDLGLELARTGPGVRLRGRARLPVAGRGRRQRGGDLCADPALRGAHQWRDASRLGPGRRSGRLRLDRRHLAGLEHGPGHRCRLYPLCGGGRAAQQGRGFAGRPLAGGRRQGRQCPDLGRGGGLAVADDQVFERDGSRLTRLGAIRLARRRA